MTKYAKLKTERADLVTRIRDYNARASAYNDRRFECPPNCHMRGEPHSHTYPQVPLIRGWQMSLESCFTYKNGG